MKIFSKKESIQQNMAFMGIMSAICLILTLLIMITDTFFIGLSIFIALLLPLASTIVSLTCKDRYYPIFFFATIGLSLVLTLYNISTTILYLIPSLITGYLFGLSAKTKFSPVFAIILSAIINAGLTYVAILVINALFSVDIINSFLVFFGLSESVSATIIVPAVMLVISLIQIFLSYLIISNEIHKFGYEYNNELNNLIIISIITMIISASIIGFYYVSLAVAYVLLVIAIYFGSTLIVDTAFKRNWKTLIVCGVSIVSSLIAYIFVFKYLKAYSGLLVYGLAPFLIGTTILVSSLLKKNLNK